MQPLNKFHRDKSNAAHQFTITRSIFSMKNFNAELDLPIVYSSNYNISMFGLELSHQFDTKKFKKIADYLSEAFSDTQYARHLNHGELNESDTNEHHRHRRLRFLCPNRPINLTELENHHPKSYIDNIHNEKFTIARITETWILNLLPQCLIESRLLTPIKWQISGTIFAFYLAMQHGWSINLGGGFHQASSRDGETFCIFSDICIAIKHVWRKHPLQKIMIIDLDAHQATGIERDITEFSTKQRELVYIVDLFNSTVNPPDSHADKGANLRIELGRFTSDTTYLNKLDEALKVAFTNFKPTLIVYISGQDILKGDQLGLMNVSEEGLLKRDEMVFSWATERERCPIVMLLGGGYLARGARVQAESIKHLFKKGLIWGGHRSGSRTLTRPRKSVETQGSKSSHTKSTTSINSEHRPLEAIKIPGNQQYKTKVVHVARVAAKFLPKKQPTEDLDVHKDQSKLSKH